MGALVATLDNGQLNTAVEQSQRILDRLGQSGAEAGKKLDQVGRSTGLKSVGTEAGRARTGVTGLTTAVRASGQAIGRSFVAGGRGIKSFASSVAGATTSVFNLRTAAVGLAASFSFSTVIGELRGFEATMAQVQGVTRATGSEFGQLQGLARDLGRTTQFSGQEAAEGVLFLARAGQDTNTILKTLPPTLKFAQAGAIGLGDAANFATNIMGGFQLEADRTEASLNALATVANRSNTDITSLASAMSFVAPAANAADVSLEITAAAIGVLGDVGIDASKAGTSLRQILIQLSNTDPPDRVVETLSKLGLTINDINPAAVGLETAFLNLRDAGLDLTDAAKLVGSEAASALLALASGSEKVAELGEEARTTTDSLDVMSAAMSNTLDGAIKRAQSAFSGLIQEIGVRGTTNFLTTAFDSIASSINFVTDNLDSVLAPVNFVINAFVELVASARFVADALIRAFGADIALLFNQTAAAVGDLTGGFSLLEPAVKGIIVAFTALAALRVAGLFLSLVNPIGVVVAVIGGLAGILLSLSGKTLPDVIRDVASFVDSVIGFFIGLKDAAVAVFGNFGTVLSEPFLKAFDLIGQLIEDFLNLLITQFNKVGAIVGLSLDPVNIITPTVRQDYEDAATDISDAFVRGLDFTGASDRIEPVLRQLEDLGSTTETSAGQATTSIAGAEAALRDMGSTARIASQETITGITAADERLKQLAQTARSAGETVQGSLINGGKAADDFTSRVGVLTGAIGQFFGELGVDIGQFARNAETTANRFGASFSGAFSRFSASAASALGLARDQVGDFGGAAGVILDEIGFTGAEVFEALGIDADSKFAQVAGAAVSAFARFTDGQFTALLDAGRNLFGRLGDLGGVFTDLIPSVTSFGSSAVSAFQGLAASAGIASAALAPIALVIAGIAALVVGTAAIFGAFGDRVQKVATVLAVVFAPFIFSVQLIVRLVQFLIDAFSNLGNVGSTIAKVLTVVFAPVVIPIRLIVEAVRFLIDLFSNLGNVGSSVSKVLTVVLAPIIIPIRLIIEAVKFLIDLFGNLGGVVRVFGGIFTGIFNGILAVGRAVFSGIQAAGQALFGALSAIGSGISGALSSAFNVVRSVASSVFGGIVSAGRAAFGALVSAASAAVGAISGALRSLVGAIGGVIGSIGGAVRSAVGAVGGAIRSVTGIGNGTPGNSVQNVVRQGSRRPVAGQSADQFVAGLQGIRGEGATRNRNFLDGNLSRSDLQQLNNSIVGGGGTVLFNSGGRAVQLPQDVLRDIDRRRRTARDNRDNFNPNSIINPFLGFRLGGLIEGRSLFAANKARPARLIEAGEAGEEFVVPAARTSSGKLGITAIAPPNAGRETGPVVINKFNIDARGAGDEVVKELRAMVRETQKSVPVISAKTAALMMKGVVRV